MKSAPKPSCEDVLDAFSVEVTHDRHTLEGYLRKYPQYVVELAHLSHELSRAAETPRTLTAQDRAAIDKAWKMHSEVVSITPVDLFASFSVPQLRNIAIRLGVPRQVITAFREHKVIVSSIPQRFLANLATAIDKTLDEVTSTLAFSKGPNFARSYKADEKPKAVEPVTFERLLIDAGVTPENRAKLMAEEG